MGYLRPEDYKGRIQPQELNAITTGNPNLLTLAERLAEAEIKAQLTQRYDVVSEFGSTSIFSFKNWNVDDLFEINFPNFNSSATYATNSLVSYGGRGFTNPSAITSPSLFNGSQWTDIGAMYDLYYAIPPKLVFNYKSYYKVGSQVYWKGKVYTALKETILQNHASDIQYIDYTAIPLINVWPDDPVNGALYWGAGTAYSVPNTILPTNTTYFAPGDNRCAQIVWYMVDIVIFELSKRLAPSNIPATRITAYKDAMQWLYDAAHGNTNVDMPELQPETGGSVIWGSKVKRINQW